MGRARLWEPPARPASREQGVCPRFGHSLNPGLYLSAAACGQVTGVPEPHKPFSVSADDTYLKCR